MREMAFNCEIRVEEVEGLRYLEVKLISGDITGHPEGSYQGLEKKIREQSEGEGLPVVIDAREYEGYIDSTAIGAFGLLGREKDLTFIIAPNKPLIGLLRVVSSGTGADGLKIVNTQKEALGYIEKPR